MKRSREGFFWTTGSNLLVVEPGHTSPETSSWRHISNQGHSSLCCTLASQPWPLCWSVFFSALFVQHSLLLCGNGLSPPQPWLHDTFLVPAPLTSSLVTYCPSSGRESSGPLVPSLVLLVRIRLGGRIVHTWPLELEKKAILEGKWDRADISTVSVYKNQSGIQQLLNEGKFIPSICKWIYLSWFKLVIFRPGCTSESPVEFQKHASAWFPLFTIISESVKVGSM